MLDLTQSVLIAVITVLTTLLVIIGLQVVNILKEFKQSLEKINKILDNAGIISENIAKPVANFSSFFEVAKGGLKIIEGLVNFLKEKKNKQQKKGQQEKEEKQEQEKEKEKEKRESLSFRCFFTRKGKKLA